MFKPRYSPVEALTIMGQGSKEVLGPNIELLLWNVFKCKRVGWERDFVMLTSGKDLILLQEAILNTPFDAHFQHSLQHQWLLARSFKHVKTNIDTGVETGSTVAAQSYAFSASKHGEPIYKTKKMLLASVYPLPLGESLLVVNAHLINFVSFDKFSVHLEQVFQTFVAHEGPIVLAGDFNTWNGKRMRYFNQRAGSFGLKEVEIRRKPRLHHLYHHLDHIYYRGLDVFHVQVHTEIHSSDHFPISLTLRTLAGADEKHSSI
jgi:endonuclease/exonuclease/phosphatase (EEP) superfamily protein YafD